MTSLRVWLSGLICVVVLAVCFLGGCSSGSSDTVTFRFDPPDSLRFSGTLVADRIVARGDTTVVDSTTMTTENLLVKQGDRYLLKTVTKTFVLSRNGQPYDDRLIDLYKGTVFVNHLDSTGKSLEYTGFEKILAKADSTMDPESARQIHNRMAPDRQAQQEVAKWNSRVTRFYGKSMTIGDVIFDSSLIGISSEATVTLYRATKFEDTTTIDGQLCARIRIVGNVDPALLGPKLGKTPQEMYTLFNIDEKRQKVINDMPFTSSLIDDFTIEVSTMLLHSENLTRISAAVSGDERLLTHDDESRKNTFKR